MAEQTIPVTLHDLALVLYLNPETGEPRRNADHICETCGESGGAHYCEPRWVAHNRLERLVRTAIATPPPAPHIEDAHCERRATLDRGPTLTHKQRLVYTRTRSLGKTHEQAVKQAMLSPRPAAA